MTLTLRKKTLVVVTLTLIALVVILYFAISSIVMGSFEDLEKDDVSRHVERVNEAIDNELSDINSKLVDWAKPGQDLDVVRLANLLDDERARVSDQRSNRLAIDRSRRAGLGGIGDLFSASNCLEVSSKQTTGRSGS